MYTRRRRVLGLIGASILALSALLLLAPTTSSRAADISGQFAPGVTTTPTATGTVTSTPTPAGQGASVLLKTGAKCAKPPQHGKDPYIAFCTPTFGGVFEGPQGSHVTVTGGNFKSLPQSIFLTSAPAGGNFSCTGDTSTCLRFSNASNAIQTGQLLKQELLGDFTLSFTWNFSPSEESSGTSYYVAVADQDGHTVYTSGSGGSFTLLSTKAPCLAIYVSGDAPDCTAQKSGSLQVLPGQSVHLAGSGWLPDDQKQTVDVSLQCIQTSGCSSASTDLKSLNTAGSGSATTGGTLTPVQFNIPDNARGQYALVGSMHDGAATFGDSSQDDSQTFTLEVKPHPCVSVSASTNAACVWQGSESPEPVSKGKTATITLQNWAQGNLSVSIYKDSVKDCAAKPNAQIGTTQTLSPASAPDGLMSASVMLPSALKVNSTYTICASGTSSVASAGKVYASLLIKITKPVTHQPFSLLSLLGLLFALVGAGVYVMTMPKRAVVPQPVGRRQ